jgi:hypothetical protein
MILLSHQSWWTALYLVETQFSYFSVCRGYCPSLAILYRSATAKSKEKREREKWFSQNVGEKFKKSEVSIGKSEQRDANF